MAGARAFPAWLERLVAPLRVQLKRGLAPRRAALALSLGLWLGVVPLPGVNTLACLLLAWGLRLNQVLMQAVNYLVYPLQLLLIVPFCAAGARLFGGPGRGLSPEQLFWRARQASGGLLQGLGQTLLRGLALWALLGLVAVPLLWAIFYWLLRRYAPPHPAA